MTDVKKLPFYIVDVFAERKYSGNQLAVVRNSSELNTMDMQSIAREMNFSETTYILSDKKIGGGYDVRIFTPLREVPFAGHPVLGTAFIIMKKIEKNDREVRLNLKVGQIPVKVDQNGVLWMRQIEPTFGEKIEPDLMAEVLGLKKGDLLHEYPVQEVSTGIPFIITPLKSLSALKRSHLVKEKFYELVKELRAKAILIFSRETYERENDLSVRVFADYYGVPEDPATGSANGCLAGYLVKYEYFGKQEIDLRVEQGYELGRPSLLYLKAMKRGESIEVNVGGKVMMIAEGYLV